MSAYYHCAVRGQQRRLSGGGDIRNILLDGNSKSSNATAVAQRHQAATKRCMAEQCFPTSKNKFISQPVSTVNQVRSLSSTVPVATASVPNDSSQEQGIKLFVGAMLASFIAGSALVYVTPSEVSALKTKSLPSSKSNAMINDSLHIPRSDPGGGGGGMAPIIPNSNPFVASQQTAVASCDGFGMMIPSSLGSTGTSDNTLDSISNKTGTASVRLRTRRLQRRNTPSSSDDDNYRYNDSMNGNSNYKQLSMFAYAVDTAVSASEESSKASDWFIRNTNRTVTTKAPFDVSS
jgi:hypothetical protein